MDEFFTTSTRARRAGESLLSSTTESQEALDRAASGRRPQKNPEITSTYVEVGPSVQAPDGSIEHGPVKIRTNLREPKPSAANFRDMVGPLSELQERAILQNLEVAVTAAKEIYPDFEEVLRAAGEYSNNAPMMRMIAAGIPNAPQTSYYLAKHPAECERLNKMAEKNPRGVQEEILKLSARLATDESADIDTADFATFRRIRNKQIRNQHR